MCGGVLIVTEGQTQEVMSPNYPVAPSNAPTRCRWVIGASGESKHVRVTVTDLQIPSIPQCTQDYLNIRDQPIILPVSHILLLSHCSTAGQSSLGQL